MKINFDFNPKSLKENETDKCEELIFNNREVVILNRKYKCKCFLSQDEADDYLEKHPNMEVLCTDDEGVNIIQDDYYGVEVNFVPYEFKRYEIETTKEVKKVEKKHSKVTWINEESKMKPDIKKKRWDN